MPTGASKTDKRVIVSDCEGPISKNDNAFELANCFVHDGDRFFALVSKYDDVLADVIKKPGYKAGDTLRLILPFLKAYGVTDKQISDFSTQNLLLVPGAEDMLTYIQTIMPSFIVSTSYEHYISALCKLSGFPFENTYCTRLNIDKYHISTKEIKRLKELGKEITKLPMIEIPINVSSASDFSHRDQDTLERLDKIFWKELPEMETGKIITEVNPIGGPEKAKAVHRIRKKMDCSLNQVIYIGDSITDAPALKLVKENGGLSVSFNGNRYSIRESDVAVISSNAIVTSVIADVFSRLGKEETLKFVNSWNSSSLEKFGVFEKLKKMMNSLFFDCFPQVEQVTPNNMERLITQSSAFRKNVRGEAIGKLG